MHISFSVFLTGSGLGDGRQPPVAGRFDPGILRTAQRVTLYPGEDARQHPEPERIAHHYVRLLGPEGRALHGQALSA